MLRTVITLLEIFVGVGGLLCVNYVRRRFGDTAAGAAGATSVLLLVHSVARTIRDSSVAKAWSVLVAAATVILVYSIFIPEASEFFGNHPNLQWGTPILLALGWAVWIQHKIFAFMIWAVIPLLWGHVLSSDLVQAAKSVTSIIPSFDSAGPASPPAYCGPAQAASGLCPPAVQPPAPQQVALCPPGQVRQVVNGPCFPKESAPAPQPAAAPAAPAPAASPSPGIAAGTIWVCDKNRKEVLTDYQLIGGGISISLFNPLRCEFTLNVKPGGTIRVTFYDNSTMDMNFQTCATPNNSGCSHRRIKSIASVTPSSIITLEVTPK